MKEEKMDILEVEEKILNNLDNLDKLLDEYIEICNKPKKTIDPLNWIKKKFLSLKK